MAKSCSTSVSSASRSRAELARKLRPGLLEPAVAEAMEVHGDRDAAVLIALYERDGELHTVFTRRRDDLRLHPGQVSFPGGRADDGESLAETALREAHEEIGLAPGDVEIAGALQPVPTFVTGFRVYPYVGVIDGPIEWAISEPEVSAILEVSLAALQAGYARRTVPTPRGKLTHGTYLIGEDLIWGATSRIVAHLLKAIAQS